MGAEGDNDDDAGRVVEIDEVGGLEVSGEEMDESVAAAVPLAAATLEQYSNTILRAYQLGKRTWFRKDAQAEGGIGRVDGVLDLVMVADGVNGLVVEGVSRALRWVEMVSSMVEREKRRNSTSQEEQSSQLLQCHLFSFFFSMPAYLVPLSH